MTSNQRRQSEKFNPPYSRLAARIDASNASNLGSRANECAIKEFIAGSCAQVDGPLSRALKEPITILRLPKVKARTGRSRSSIYADPSFPKAVAIGKRSVGWVEEEIQNWLSGRVEQTRGVAAVSK